MTRTIEDFEGAIFDSREVIERIQELEDLAESDAYTLDEDETAELASLRELASEADGYIADWKYGEAFIPESEFEDYARQLAEDIGAIKDDASWPMTYIDWPAAAAALMQDYTAIEWRGTTYYAR